MTRFSQMPLEERSIFIEEASARLGVLPVIVEKDFWVTWNLARLFEKPEYSSSLVFKGGTSLSKVFGAIQRFSEDIDLSISPSLLGHEDTFLDDAPSSSQRRKRVQEIEELCATAVESNFQSTLEASFKEWLGLPDGREDWLDYQLDPATKSPTLFFSYPATVRAGAGYIVQNVKIEFGSLTDVFDGEVPEAWRNDLWKLIKSCGNLDWFLLTKRPENIGHMLPECWDNGWPNVWLGTTVENQQRANERIPIMRDIPAAVRFLSMEPVLEEVELNLEGIDWVVAGGESGPGYRTMKAEWATSVRDQCIESKIPFFFKQWGGISPKQTGSLLEGEEWKEFPPRHPGRKITWGDAARLEGCAASGSEPPGPTICLKRQPC